MLNLRSSRGKLLTEILSLGISFSKGLRCALQLVKSCLYFLGGCLDFFPKSGLPLHGCLSQLLNLSPQVCLHRSA